MRSEQEKPGEVIPLLVFPRFDCVEIQLLDLSEHLLKRSRCSFLVRAVAGNSDAVATLDGQTHYCENLLEVSGLFALGERYCALEALGGLAQQTGRTACRPSLS